MGEPRTPFLIVCQVCHDGGATWTNVTLSVASRADGVGMPTVHFKCNQCGAEWHPDGPMPEGPRIEHNRWRGGGDGGGNPGG